MIVKSTVFWMWRHRVWKKFTDVSEDPISIISTLGSLYLLLARLSFDTDYVPRQYDPSKRQRTRTRLHGDLWTLVT
jgi:hypothetical protein